MAVLPRTLILLLLFLTAFVWTAVLLMMLLAARLRWLRWDVTHAFAFRLAITVFTIVLLCAVAQVNVVRLCCRLSFRFYPVQFSNWLIDSLSSSLADWEIRAPLLWFLATLPRPAPPKIPSSNRGMDRTGHRPQTTVRHLGQYGQCGQSYGFHHRIAKPSHAGNFVF